MSQEANFIRVKLGDIRPNRFRNLERWPVEPGVIEELKQSIHEHGFWNGLQAIRNEQGQIELRFGHHRLRAGLEIFGPDHEITIELTPFHGEWNLMRALHAENSIRRSSARHLYEIVSQVAHWWDDVVFEKHPTWEACERSGVFSRPLLEEYFGPFDGNRAGVASYAKCARYGIGRDVIARMLGRTVSADSIRHALAILPPTNRRTHGLKLQAEEDRRKAEAWRAEADRLATEREALGRQMKEEAQKQQAELAHLADEERKAKAEAKAAGDAEAKRLAGEKQRQLKEELAAKKAQREAEEKAALQAQEEKRAAINQAEKDARRAETRATNTEQAIEAREWFDARAAEVFDRPSHGAAFRLAVSHPDVQPFLQTADLVSFATAIRKELARQEEILGKEMLTAGNIREMVTDNFRTFRQGIKQREREARYYRKVQGIDFMSEFRRKVEACTATLRLATHDLDSLGADIIANNITAANLGCLGIDFLRAYKSHKRALKDFERFKTQAEHEIQPIPLKQLAHAKIPTDT